MSSREGFLENKLASLELRLTRVERFIEKRFYESVEDAASSAEISPSPSKSKGKPKPPKVSPGKAIISPGKSKSVDAIRSKMKDCFTLIDSKSKKPKNVAPEASTNSTNPYGTRRQKKLAEAESVISAPADAEENGSDDEDDNNDNDSVMFDLDDDNDNDEGDDSGRDNEDFDLKPEVSNLDPNPPNNDDDPDWSEEDRSSGKEEDDDDNDNEDGGWEEEKKKLRATRPPKRKSNADARPPRQKRKRYGTEFGSLSIEKLSDAKVVSTDPTRGECPICHYHFKHEFLPIHVATHTKERHLKCSKCDKEFWKMETYRKHYLTVHDINNYKRRCRNCGKPIIGNLLHHEQYCLKKAWERGEDVNLKLVEEIQKRVRKVGRDFVLPDRTQKVQYDPTERRECPECGKKFLMQYYDRHVESHKKAKNWKCSKCSKAYIHKHDLVRHMIQIHENKPVCQHCNASFETRRELHHHKIRECEKDIRYPIRLFANSGSLKPGKAKADGEDWSTDQAEVEEVSGVAASVSEQDQQPESEPTKSASIPKLVAVTGSNNEEGEGSGSQETGDDTRQESSAS